MKNPGQVPLSDKKILAEIAETQLNATWASLLPRCAVSLIHDDKSASRCVMPASHRPAAYVQRSFLPELQSYDGDHMDEHGCLTRVLVSQATVRQAEAIEDEREQAYRDREQREAAIAALAERFWQGAALPAERMAGHLAAIAWESGWRPPASGGE